MSAIADELSSRINSTFEKLRQDLVADLQKSIEQQEQLESGAKTTEKKEFFRGTVTGLRSAFFIIDNRLGNNPK